MIRVPLPVIEIVIIIITVLLLQIYSNDWSGETKDCDTIHSWCLGATSCHVQWGDFSRRGDQGDEKMEGMIAYDTDENHRDGTYKGVSDGENDDDDKA